MTATVALDLDGTLIENRWPELGEWLPGAQESVRTMLDAGCRCFIYTARLSPVRMDGSRRGAAELLLATQAVRDLLDEAGLREVDIWTGEGKPFWHVLVDDRAVRFPGRPGSWPKILPRVLVHAGARKAADALLHGEDAAQ